MTERKEESIAALLSHLGFDEAVFQRGGPHESLMRGGDEHFASGIHLDQQLPINGDRVTRRVYAGHPAVWQGSEHIKLKPIQAFLQDGNLWTIWSVGQLGGLFTVRISGTKDPNQAALEEDARDVTVVQLWRYRPERVF